MEPLKRIKISTEKVVKWMWKYWEIMHNEDIVSGEHVNCSSFNTTISVMAAGTIK